MGKVSVKSVVPTDFAQDAKFFASDVDVDAEGRVPILAILYLHIVEAVNLEIAYDGDAGTYVALGPVTVANALSKFVIPIDAADTINVRASDVGGGNVRKGKMVMIFDDVD